ncbi:MAG TPA: carboxylating nicotinate-nucleotide diphosphorylase [Actinobacteria bacterium]|nr:carboxylating nicotinate-nucleotide diphosphorylase [Actinomycetota bacterium]
MNPPIPPSDTLIAMALAEDLGMQPERFLGGRGARSPLDADVTSASTVGAGLTFSGRVVAREAGVVCGLPLVERVFSVLAQAADAAPADCFPLVAEGADVAPGEAVMEIDGCARLVLAGERTALDMLMILSGIATEARRWQREAGPSLVVTDTRKTVPGLRALSKYAVRVGGAANHRIGLYDMVLIKDNHIAHAGSVAAAVEAARRMHPELLVECEADSVEQAVEAARSGAHYVLLDNMDDEMLTRAVAAVREAAGDRDCLTEASGRITFQRLSTLAATGVDRVSSSALTMARPLDFGFDAE